MKTLSLSEFLKRVKKRESVSRLDFSLGFEWDADAVKALLKVVAELRVDLSLVDLSSADLSSADLSSADLRSADLSSVNLSSADLSSADLRSADLSYADLSYADLSSANLSYADLRSADLRFADLSSADLSSANVGFSFSLPCGLNLQAMLSSLKNATPRLKEYLTVQALAHLAAESKKTPLEFMRDYFNAPTTAKIVRVKKLGAKMQPKRKVK